MFVDIFWLLFNLKHVKDFKVLIRGGVGRV